MKHLEITHFNRSGARGELRVKQRGVVLFVALVVLVVMSLGGISMMRAADTGTQIAGNLAFRQSALQAAERAFEQAMQNISVISSTGATRSQNLALCYYSNYLAVSSANDLPWATACDLGVDSVTGNRVKLIVNRLSNGTFDASTKVPAQESPGSSKKCPGGCGQKDVYNHYRIIARVSDSKGMVTTIEEKIY